MLPNVFFGSSSYFVFISLVYTFLVYVTYRKSQQQKLSTLIALNLALIIMVFGFLGARLTHIVWENPQFYSDNPLMILAFWQGGFVFYGGAAAAFAASLIYLKRIKQSRALWLDFYAPIIALGYALGRVGCFLVGCCYGQYCDWPWAVAGRHPTQLYATALELINFALLIKLGSSWRSAKPGALFATWLCLHALGRLVMEYYRDDFRGDVIYGLSLSMWISIILLSVSLGFLFHKRR